jgi:glycine cleavage system protein P-like pyridoxal-binding family
VFVVIFPKAFSKNAKAMDEFIKKLEAFNKDLKKYYNQSQQVKSINLARAQARANQLDAATSQRPEIQQPRQAA